MFDKVTKMSLIREIFLGNVVVDIGAAPGSWSQVAAEIVFGGPPIASDPLGNKPPVDGIEHSGYVLGVDLQVSNGCKS